MSELNCVAEGENQVAKTVKIKTNQKIAFIEGATLGDGASSIDIIAYRVSGKDGYYKVELDSEDCTVRNTERVNN